MFGFFHRPPKALPPRARVLIIRFSSLGDLVKTTGLPRQIKARYPTAHLTVLTASTFLPMVAHNPHVDQALGFDRKTGLGGLIRLAMGLRAQRFHLVLDVHRSLRSRLVCWLMNAPSLGYSKRTIQRVALVGFGWDTYHPPQGKEADFLAPLARYQVINDGLGTQIQLPPHLPAQGIPASHHLAPSLERIEAWKNQGQPVLGIAPVAAWPLKCWPLDHVRTLMEAYLQQTNGGIVVFGGPGDHAVSNMLGQLPPQWAPRLINLVGQTSLLESAWVAARCQVMVANDTGMLHITEAVGRPVVALFGPTTRHLGYFPVRPDSVVVETPLPCRPCTKNGKGRCSQTHHQACMDLIHPQQVLEEVLKRLNSQPVTGT